MQFNFVFIATALLASASTAMSASVTLWDGEDCTGSQEGTFTVPPAECFTFGSSSVKSISYSGVPSQIEFFVPSGAHTFCATGAYVRGAGSGCATAPNGLNWESLVVF